MKRKISVTTGSRSEYGIIRSVLQGISKSKKFDLYLIVAGMHLSKKHGMTINEIKKDGFRIYDTVPMLPKDDSNFSMSIAFAKGVTKFSQIFKKLKPDINLILGDRDEMLASAIAAYHMNIPNAHIHGGDKSKGGIDEYNRHAITKMSNIHYAATSKSKKRIIKMGENPKYVFLTGSPSVDEIISNKITQKKELERKYKITFSGQVILFVQHSVTTESEKSQEQIINTLKAITKLKKTTIAIAPNSDPGSKKIYNQLLKNSKKNILLKVYPNIPRTDYLGLLKNCGVLVGNSSSGMIEGSYFNTPVVNIGIRQENREGGKNIINVKSGNWQSIHKAIRNGLKMKKLNKFKIKKIYGNGKTADKILRNLEKISLNKELIKKQIFY